MRCFVHSNARISIMNVEPDEIGEIRDYLRLVSKCRPIKHWICFFKYHDGLEITILLTHLNMTINEPVQFNIVIVLSKWIDQDLSNFQPSNIKTKL